ncbi:MAG: restriction endonuclease subunit S [Candidatus Ryanbacteria bacterium]|nr:restriction endonuclease subunit S [Candidatus Ryanbacteria bacterium]
MSKFVESELGPLLDMIIDYRGKTPKKLHGDWVSSGIPALSAKNIKHGKIVNPESIRFVNSELYARWMKEEVKRGDILMTSEAPLGETFYVKNDDKILLSQRLFAIRTKDNKLVSRFLYYYFNSPFGKHELLSRATGTTVGGIRQTALVKVMVRMPESISTQRQISSVLSAYDDLIENNEKRIKALEEMAQLLYTEWFVKFKFPGHEKVKMVDSGTEYGKIPQGWAFVEMRSVAKIIDCLHTKKPDAIKTGNKILLQLNNILDNGMISLAEKYLISDTDYEKWTANIELRDGDCVVTNVGRIAASAQIANGVVAAAGRNMTVIRPEKIPASFLIQYLHSRHMVKEVSKKTDAGAIMGSLNVKNIYLLKVLLPDRATLESFGSLAHGIRAEMNKLNQQNYVLSQIRDLLIPQLVTGKRELK